MAKKKIAGIDPPKVDTAEPVLKAWAESIATFGTPAGPPNGLHDAIDRTLCALEFFHRIYTRHGLTESTRKLWEQFEKALDASFAIFAGTDERTLTLLGEANDNRVVRVGGLTAPSYAQLALVALFSWRNSFIDSTDDAMRLAGFGIDFDSLGSELFAEWRRVQKLKGTTSGDTAIPVEHRTKPMSFRQAARLMGKTNSKKSAEWLSRSVSGGDYKAEKRGRQNHVFDCRDFPANAQKLIRPELPTDPN